MTNKRLPLGKVEGPILITPPTPRPYMSCCDCVQHHKTSEVSGTGQISYHHVCHHPEIVAKGSIWIQETALDGNEHKPITPDWCPYLKKEK